MYGHRVVKPLTLQQQVLKDTYEGHMGTVNIKSLAMMCVWWPKIDEHIEANADHCVPCQENSRDPVKAPVLIWRGAGPYEGSMWLIVIDAATKWPEVIRMNSNMADEWTIITSYNSSESFLMCPTPTAVDSEQSE